MMQLEDLKAAQFVCLYKTRFHTLHLMSVWFVSQLFLSSTRTQRPCLWTREVLLVSSVRSTGYLRPSSPGRETGCSSTPPTTGNTRSLHTKMHRASMMSHSPCEFPELFHILTYMSRSLNIYLHINLLSASPAL